MISRPAPECAGPRCTTPPTWALPFGFVFGDGGAITVPCAGFSAGAGLCAAAGLPPPATRCVTLLTLVCGGVPCEGCAGLPAAQAVATGAPISVPHITANSASV